MSKKTKTIFIGTFIAVVVILLIIFLFFRNSSNERVDNTIDPNKQFDPFQTGNTNNNVDNQVGNIDSNGNIIDWKQAGQDQPQRFHQLTDFAVAGATYFESIKNVADDINKSIKSINTPTLRYVERVTGHIYQMNLNTKNQIKVSNSTIPGVYEVFFDKLADNFIYRYLSVENKSIASFTASLGKDIGKFLPFNIISVSVSPDKNSFFYLVKNSSGVSGYTKSFDNSKTSNVFESAFTDWSSQWVSDETVFLNTKPSYMVSGSLFNLNTKNKTLNKIFGGIKGLTTLSNVGGTSILYGSSLNIGPRLFLLNTENHDIKDLDLYGLPEKCVWDNTIYIYCAVPNTIIGSRYPDVWYQGLVSFDDFFVKINTKTGKHSTLANSKNETSVDATNLFIDAEKNNLFFINKKDSTLWSLDI